jgi:hypothetical protein
MYRKSFILIGPALGLFLLTAFADGTITDVQPIGKELHLSVRTSADNIYQLQCTTNLLSDVWLNVGEEITAVSGSTNLIVSAEADRCWFRVLEEVKTSDSLPVPPSEPPALPSQLD